MICNQCGSRIPDGKLSCPDCGAYITKGNQNVQENVYPQNQPYPGQDQLGMKWFNFIIYCQLFVTAIFNLVSGLLDITKSEYSNYSDIGLGGYSEEIGIFSVVIAIFAIITRFKLARFEKKGPAMYIGLQVVGVVFQFLILVNAMNYISSYAIDRYRINPKAVAELAGYVSMLVVNIKYFKNRKHMFVN